MSGPSENTAEKTKLIKNHLQRYLLSKFDPPEAMSGYGDYLAECWKGNHFIGASLGIVCVWLTFLVDLLLHLFWSPLDIARSLLFSVCNTASLGTFAVLAFKSPSWAQKVLVHMTLACVALFSGASAGTVDSSAPVPFYWSIGFCIVAVCGAYPNRVGGALGLSGLTLSSFCFGYISYLESWDPSLMGGMVLLGAAAPVIALIGSVSLDSALRTGFNSRRLAEISKDRLAITLRDIGDGVIVVDDEGSVVLFNRKAQEILEWTEEEARQLRLNDLFAWFDKLDHSNQPPREVKATKRGGQEIWISLTVSQMDGMVLAFQDITERKRQEKDRMRASRLDALGLVAGGIAHDFNNLLTAVLGNSSVLLEDPSLAPDVRAALKSVEQASLRAGDLANQLLTFAKGGAPIKEVSRIDELVVASSTFVLAGSGVKLDLDQAEDLWSAEVDSTQIGQVVQNLAVNAAQAMPQGGSLKIRSRNVELFEHDGELKAGSYILIEFEDEGVGIPSSVLDKIFDPYFTTKESGSGLGLATTYSVLTRHGGPLGSSRNLAWARSSVSISLPLQIHRSEPEKENGPDGGSDRREGSGDG